MRWDFLKSTQISKLHIGIGSNRLIIASECAPPCARYFETMIDLPFRPGLNLSVLCPFQVCIPVSYSRSLHLISQMFILHLFNIVLFPTHVATLCPFQEVRLPRSLFLCCFCLHVAQTAVLLHLSSSFSCHFFFFFSFPNLQPSFSQF